MNIFDTPLSGIIYIVVIGGSITLIYILVLLIQKKCNSNNSDNSTNSNNYNQI